MFRVLRSRGSIVVLIVLLAAGLALAVPASAAKPGAATLEFLQPPTDSSAGEIISPAVVVVARNAKGQITTKVKGNITLALQGAGTLYGTSSKPAVAGQATFSDLVVDPAGAYTLVASAQGFASATAGFNITGFATDCGAGGCSLSTGNIGNPTPEDNIIGVVSVSTDECGAETCFLTVDEIVGDFCGGPCVGNAVKFITPSNSIDIAAVDFGCDKSLCPGTGVPNFPLYLQKADLSVIPLVDCSEPEPAEGELPCIQSRSRTGVGDVVWTVWLTPEGDPAIGRG